ncbi:MAG: 30S ribosome-binding factor RbfA [Clostridia bacterium]|nr:30S ribosome-binding factor RbfA [Clostridia bacterium]
MEKGNNRLSRIEEELKKEISNIINYDLRNSNITGMVSVTKVKVSPDLSRARVFVTMYNSNKKNTLAALKSSSGYIRREIAHKVNLRVTPELIFEFDESIEYGAKIDSILKEIIKEPKPKEGEDE